MNYIYFDDNLNVLKATPDDVVDLIYIDPPFNTGKSQSRTRISVRQAADGDRRGFQGRLYETIRLGTCSYDDRLGDQFLSFIEPRLREAHRVLAPHGSIYFHIDYREVHYCQLLLDEIFGPDNFLNEIIWAYDYGGRSTRKWPDKHDNILVYAKQNGCHTFHGAEPEEGYVAPGSAGASSVAPSDVWWHTIVPTYSAERTGYPTQKPLGIINRIVRASSNPGGLVMDFFAGSGTTGESCLQHGRRFILVDNNLQAMETMARRFAGVDEPICWTGYLPTEPGEAHQPASADRVGHS
jgi:site-specific DNA-methyltransferase (adenine-specific)